MGALLLMLAEVPNVALTAQQIAGFSNKIVENAVSALWRAIIQTLEINMTTRRTYPHKLCTATSTDMTFGNFTFFAGKINLVGRKRLRKILMKPKLFKQLKSSFPSKISARAKH